MKRKLQMAALAVLTAGLVGGVYAAHHEERDETAGVLSARISLTQAIAAAEQHTGGKASRAEIERHDGKWLYEVEVVSGGKTAEVAVDATDGKVISMQADRPDGADEDDADD